MRFSLAFRRNILNVQGKCSKRFSGTTVQAPTTTTVEKMKKDKRYAAVSEVPEAVLQSMHSDKIHSPGFSIKGEAVEGRPAYLDFQATTPMDPRVVDAMLPFMLGKFGNPHSSTHAFGWETEAAIEESRGQIAELIGLMYPLIFISLYH